MKYGRWLLCLLLFCPALAQGREQALTDAEVETLRERAPDPPARVQAFVAFLDDRTKAIESLAAGKRKPGREEDLLELMQQFSLIANDLEDNLDEYSKRHRDLRKILPKLQGAAERWATALRTPADDEGYTVARRLALEAVADIRQTATELLAEQKSYFLAHPPGKGDTRANTPEAQGRSW